MVRPSYNDLALPFIDPITGKAVQMPHESQLVYAGKAFFNVYSETLASTNDTSIVVLNTPSNSTGLYVFWRPATLGATAGLMKVEYAFGVTYTGGTNLTDTVVFNRNLSLNTTLRPSSTFIGNPTITDTGTLLSPQYIGGEGIPVAASGGTAGQQEEFVLPQGASCMVRITNLHSTSNIFYSTINWVERLENE